MERLVYLMDSDGARVPMYVHIDGISTPIRVEVLAESVAANCCVNQGLVWMVADENYVSTRQKGFAENVSALRRRGVKVAVTF